MQNTRLSSLLNGALSGVSQGLSNPWRRISLLTISFLLGNFVGTAISTIAGQNANLDTVVAAVLLVFTEVYSWFFYKMYQKMKQSLLAQSLNAFKIGLIYNLFILAFTLGS
ncbi:DUF565 domain-containing protein [Phormidium sp. CCY1219]|jgi:hypothetical protein|uniref:DUF565 domain-containing protein n=1 Tax=Phormidium sp. CCY1219 TaxID=2886104 RepID=UPI002D1F54F5|nr:DUF565 domain-containing protein [Phormidium sp. CCY1219]MEB3830684.1 DUF565 domain-containing protein [Phormidium sp. CCY1219]